MLLAPAARGSSAFPAARLTNIPPCISATDKNGNEERRCELGFMGNQWGVFSDVVDDDIRYCSLRRNGKPICGAEIL